MSRTGSGSEPDDGEELGDDDAPDGYGTRRVGGSRYIVPQVRCSMPIRAVCDLDTGVNWWLEESDQC